jgi:hypothetical protein
MAGTPPAVAHYRAAIANRHYLPDDHPEKVELLRNLRAASLEAAVEKTLAGWPPLSDEQCRDIAALLLDGAA